MNAAGDLRDLARFTKNHPLIFLLSFTLQTKQIFLGKHLAKVPSPILRIFWPVMIFEKHLYFEDSRRTKFAAVTIFYYLKVHVKLLDLCTK